MWDWIALVAVALAVWVAVAAVVGVLLGRMVRRRDRQVPGGGADSFPAPRKPAEGPVPERGRRT